jgi:transposase-like protein
VQLLEEHAGNISAVARACGRQRVQIHRWIRRFGIDLEALRRSR